VKWKKQEHLEPFRKKSGNGEGFFAKKYEKTVIFPQKRPPCKLFGRTLRKN